MSHNSRSSQDFSASSTVNRRGYFIIGAERISKSLNLGNILRSAHAFGASFTFTVGATYRALEAHADTSKSQHHVPHFNWSTVDDIILPQGAKLVGVEVVPDAILLPNFKHPLQAAYVFGPEKGCLSEALLSRCDYVVKIPMSFCVNVAIAAAIVMYDRVKSLSNFPPLPFVDSQSKQDDDGSLERSSKPSA